MEQLKWNRNHLKQKTVGNCYTVQYNTEEHYIEGPRKPVLQEKQVFLVFSIVVHYQTLSATAQQGLILKIDHRIFTFYNWLDRDKKQVVKILFDCFSTPFTILICRNYVLPTNTKYRDIAKGVPYEIQTVNKWHVG